MQGLSFLALILLSCKLYTVDREIHYLQHVAQEWLSPEAINRDLFQHFQLDSTLPPSSSPASSSSSPQHAHYNIYSMSPSSFNRSQRLNRQADLFEQAAYQSNVGASTLAPGSVNEVVSHSANSKLKPLSSIKNKLANQTGRNLTATTTTAMMVHNHNQHAMDPRVQNALYLVENFREDIDTLISKFDWGNVQTYYQHFG